MSVGILISLSIASSPATSSITPATTAANCGSTSSTTTSTGKSRGQCTSCCSKPDFATAAGHDTCKCCSPRRAQSTGYYGCRTRCSSRTSPATTSTVINSLQYVNLLEGSSPSLRNKPSGQAVLKMHHFNSVLSMFEVSFYL